MSLRYALLVVLDKQDATGYGITKWFDGPLGYFWNTSHQRVYRALATLYEDGLVDFEVVHQTDKPDKKVYRITPGGRTALREWLATPAKPAVFNDAFLVKLFAGRLDSVEELLQELAFHIKEHERLLEAFRAVEQKYFAGPVTDPEQRMMYLTLKRGFYYEEGSLKWAREAQDVLQDLRDKATESD